MKFDDYVSGRIDITNGIGQGDPLSMLLYILYNADLLEIPDNELKEDAIGYVDDIALVAQGDNFDESTHRLELMMTKEDRASMEQGTQLQVQGIEISNSPLFKEDNCRPRLGLRTYTPRKTETNSRRTNSRRGGMF